MKRRERLDRKLFDLAAQHWLEWLLLFHAPRRQGHRTSDAGSVWEASVQMGLPRSNTEHSDCVLSAVLRDERAGWDWPASIHAIVCDMPRHWQIVMLGLALGKTQTQIGASINMRQPHVCTLIPKIREHVMTRILLLASTDRACRKILGYTPTPSCAFV